MGREIFCTNKKEGNEQRRRKFETKVNLKFERTIIGWKKSNTKGNLKNARSEKLLHDVTIKPTTDKQTNNWPTILFETEYFHLKKRYWSDSSTIPLPSQSNLYPPG